MTWNKVVIFKKCKYIFPVYWEMRLSFLCLIFCKITHNLSNQSHSSKDSSPKQNKLWFIATVLLIDLLRFEIKTRIQLRSYSNFFSLYVFLYNIYLPFWGRWIAKQTKLFLIGCIKTNAKWICFLRHSKKCKHYILIPCEVFYTR